VLKFRSVKSIVMAPARTGKERRSKTAVTATATTNSGVFSAERFFLFMLLIVAKKLMAPKIEETPAKCNEKIVISIDMDLCAKLEDNGGYIVHPVPTPIVEKEAIKSRDKAGGSSQNLILFIRGKAISGAPIIIGINQLPKPPIMIGITIKKIIMKACEVTIEL